MKAKSSLMTKFIGRVYLIVYKPEKKFYVGSTTKTLEQRLKKHIYDSKDNSQNKRTLLALCKSKKPTDFSIHELATVNTDKKDLFKLEMDYIQSVCDKPGCLNELKSYRPERTEADEKQLKHSKEKCKCECGCMISNAHIARHRLSIKHKEFVKSRK